MKGLSTSEIESVKAHLEEHGASLGGEAKWVKKGAGNCLCSSEQIAITPEGIRYKWQRGRKSESTFVAWDKINIAVFPSGGCFGDYIIIKGELDIVTEKKFPKAVVKELKMEVEKQGLGAPTGYVYRPSLLKGFKVRRSNCVVLTDKAVVAKLSRKSVDASEIPKNSKNASGTTIVIPYENINKIKKNKDFMSITGDIKDLRTGEEASIKLNMPKPFICAWCDLKGKIKGKIK